MTPAQAIEEIEHRLAALRFDFSSPSLPAALEAFQRHVLVPVEGASSYLMVEAGTYDFEFQPVRPAFTVNLTHQFGFFEESEFSHYEQLHLILYAPATTELATVQMSEFCDDGEDKTAFLNSAYSHEAITLAKGVQFTAAILKQWTV